ncbi:MAG: hypothetical protein JST66_15715 [Bacteroidetes bacterium]|nr:hypothetical protein [Bacteroidota bacterium]
MSRWLLFMISILWSLMTRATTCSTLADGAFTDPAIWSCGCDPSSCDTLIIEHEVFHTGDLMLSANYLRISAIGSLSVSGRFEVDAGLSCEGVVNAWTIMTMIPYQARCSGTIQAGTIHIENADTFFNTGHIEVVDTLFCGDFSVMVNDGSITADRCFSANVFYNNASCTFNKGLGAGTGWVNAGDMAGGGAFSFHGFFENEAGAVIRTDSLFIFNNTALVHGTITTDSAFFIGNQFISGGMTLYPDGAVVCHDFYNYGLINGGGSICIAAHSENHGALQGVIDICDATPLLTQPPFLDLNDGTFTLGVDYCEDGYCASIQSVNDQDVSRDILVVPNPASGPCIVRMPSALSITSYDLVDPHGRVVQHGITPPSNELMIQAPGMVGAYSLVLHARNGARMVKPVVLLP